MATASKPESFLILMADQLAAEWLPAYGHPLVQTPHLDGLADGAAVFDSAYTPFPLCAPARAAMITGRYASNVGVYDNAAELRATAPTLFHALRAAGYYTAISGKMHFVGPDQLHGAEDRVTTDIYPADVEWTPDWSRSLDDPLPWYHTMESVLDPGVSAASLQTDYDGEVSFRASRKLYEIARHRAEEPFLLFVSFTNPHDPWEIPSRHWDRYRREEIEGPAVPSLPLTEADPHSRRLRAMCGVDEADIGEAEIRRARHAYYAALSYLDERVGEVLAALRATGLDDSTTILFCADHGEMLGERGLWYKMSFHEQSARIPFIVRRPGGGQTRRIAEPVSLLDVAPTLLELAGIANPLPGGPPDGASLADAVRGAGPAPDRPVVSEYEAEGVQAPAAMVRRGPYKLIASPEDPDLLYHLEDDPLELRDLSGDSAHAGAAAELHAELDARLDLDAIDGRVRTSQRERHLIARALGRGRYTPWDHQPVFDASKEYVRNRAGVFELLRQARLDERAGGGL